MQERSDRNSRKKRAVNLSIDADLVAEAKEAGTNMSALLERALREELRERRWQKWRAENREAIAESNRELERNGLWSDRYRVW